METDAAPQLFGMFRLFGSGIDGSAIKGELIAFGKSINNSFNPKAVPSMDSLLSVIKELGTKDDVTMVRTKMIAWAENAKGTAEDPAVVSAIDRVLTSMNSAYGRGELIGYAAPELNFNWSSNNNISKLSDLKGKVVIIDFWATWCGPCIGSFPDVAKLKKFYEGYPVEIVGVTSLQGFHKGKDGRVETKDNPDQEYGLMPNFMKWKGMTWNVAFSAEPVFNPEYGVQGIPHVAIVDTEGKVRFNKIHPSSQVTPFAEKVDKINSLLKEANLEYPVYDDAHEEEG